MAPDIHEAPRTAARTTFAIGLFDSFVAVKSALRDLANHGFGGDRVRIFTAIGQHGLDAIDGDAPAAHRRLRHIATGVGADDPSGWVSDMLRGAMTRNVDRVVEPVLSRPDPAADDPHRDRFAMSGLDRQADKLKRHLDNGGSVLVIAVDDPGEQQAVCSMLLHYASDGVQTHQLRRRRGG
ncbi:MAG: hypothetical protein ACK4MF_01400 [Hyphomicrobiaceae bacterium]